MDNNIRKAPEMKSAQTKWERILAIGYLPVHIVLLPTLAVLLMRKSGLDNLWLNVGVYAFGMVFMLVTQFKFLRRDFDTLCDSLVPCILQVVFSYGAMLCFNMFVGTVLLLVTGAETVANPNNNAVAELSKSAFGPTAAMAMYMAPILEELMFRAGIFGTLRKYSRVGAYIVSILAFSLYHVWAFAISDPRNLIYILQYLPISFLLCRCYEYSDTIWTPIFLHMTVNTVSINMLEALSGL